MELNNLKAAIFVVIAMTMISTNDAVVKHLTQVFNVGQIIFLRGAVICVIFALFMRMRKQPLFTRQVFHRWNLLRGLFELVSTLAFLTGLSLLPIAVASTLGFASPIFLALLVGATLQERVGRDRWLVILIGFGGVVLVTDPFADATSWAVIFPIVCAFFVAVRDIAIRYVPDDIPSSRIAFTNAWIVMLGGGAYSLYQGWNHAEPHWYLWFIGLGGTLYCGYLFLIMGSRLGELSYISPFKYVSILIALVYGYVFWGDLPSLSMISGALVIVCSGIILVASEKRRTRATSLNSRA